MTQILLIFATGLAVYAVYRWRDSLRQVESLGRARRDWEEIFQAIGHPAMILDPDHRIIEANRATAALMGKSAAAFRGRKCWEFFHHQDRPPADCPLVKLKNSRQVETVEMEVEALGGFFLVSCTPVFDTRGRLQKIVHLITDITGRKRAEESLAASEANYRTIFDAGNDGIFVHDAATGAILDVNQNVLDFANLTLEEIKGRNIEEITGGGPPYTQKEALAWIRRAAAGEPQAFHWSGKDSSGRQNWWEINLKRVDLSGKECVITAARNITARLLAQEALEKSERRYQSMFRDSPLSLWQEDFSGVKAYLDNLRSRGVEDIRAYFTANPGAVAECADLIKVIDVNKAALKLYEAGSKEELFQGLCYVLTDESYQVFEEITMALAEGRTLFEGEGRIQTLKGKKLHVIIRLSVVPGFEQSLCQVLLSLIDITERKLAEEGLRKYEFITSASKEYMTLINRDYVYEAANAAYCAAHGMTQAEVVGKTVAGIWGKRAFNQHIRKFLEHCFAGHPGEYEGWFRFRGQGKRYYNVSYSPFFHTDGTVAYTAVVTHDLTERRQAEEALKESQQKYRNIFEKAPVAIFQSTIEGKMIDVNPEGAKMLGYPSPGELLAAINRSSMEKTIYADPAMRPEIIEKLQASPGQWLETRAKLRRKDAREIMVRMLLRQLQGDPTRLEGFVEDITGRLQAEEEKRQLESQLLQAQKMEAIGTLAGGIAHDFNNILASLIGYTELAVDDTPEGTEARANLDQVLRAGRRAKDLVKQILTFSRRDQLERQPVQVSLIVKEALKFLRASLPATIDIRQNIVAAAGKTLADPTQIHQVLLNLCTNAVQAMGETGGVLEVRLEETVLPAANQDSGPDLPPGPYLRLTVNDNGEGMDPETVGRIFEPFFTTKDRGKGTGLGLAVVHGILKNLGGDILVNSERGKGTVFQVYFPALEDRETTPPAVSPEITNGHERILVVDDEEDLVKLWEKTLTRLGYRVVGKNSGPEALEAFRAEPGRFDLVVTDQTMPLMTGASLARELVRLRPDIPIILCTGFSDSVQEEDLQALGIKELVNKPLSKGEIAVIIKKVLGKDS